jgi:hypothetical protein
LAPTRPQPIQFPADWPPHYPVHQRDETMLIMLDCAKQRRGLVEFCRCVVKRLIPLFTEAPDSSAVNELVRYVLISNERNANQRYDLHQQVWQSEEWAALVKAAAAKAKPKAKERPPAAAPQKPELSRSERVEEFLRRMHSPPEPKFKKRDFCIVAEIYAADFRHWQGDDRRQRPLTAERIERVLKMERDEFVSKLNSLTSR